MAYLGKTPSQAVRSRYYFTASGGETSLSGTDDNSNTLTFTDGNYVDVNLNGVTLVAGTDYNTTTANTIGGLTALVASDVVEVIVYDTFSVFSGNVNSNFSVGGDLSVTGTSSFAGNATFGDNDKAIFGAGSDLQVFHDATDSHVVTTNGDLNLQVAGAGTINLGDQFGNTLLKVVDNADVKLYHGTTPSEKLATTSSGIDVTGTVTADGLTVDSSGGGLTFSGGGNTFISATSSPLIFQTSSGTERMRITGTGDVGIGTSSPSSTLAVETGGIASLSSYAGHIVVGPSSRTSSSGDYSGGILFDQANGVQVSGKKGASIVGFQDGSDVNSMGLTFNVHGTDGSANREEAMRIDSSGNVGIGTSSPSSFNGGANNLVVGSGSGSEGITIYADNASNSAVFFADTDSTTTGQLNYQHASNAMTFHTNGGTERMRISSNGELLVGKTASDNSTVGTRFQSDGFASLVRDGDASLLLRRNTSDGNILRFNKAGTDVGSIGVADSGDRIYLAGGGLEGVGIDNGANAFVPTSETGAYKDNHMTLGRSDARFTDLYLSGGAYLGGTASANKLDDVETGTFTPDYRPQSGSFGTITHDIQIGYYQVIGTTVHIKGFIRTDACTAGTASGAILIGGLPYTSTGNTNSHSVINSAFAYNFAGENPMGGYIEPNTAVIRLVYRSTSQSDASDLIASDMSNTNNGNSLMFSGWYRID